MRKAWRLSRLGDLTERVVEPVNLNDAVEYRTLGVKWYAKGTFQRDPKSGADIKATKLYRVRPGQFIYNRMFATEGSFAVARAEDVDALASIEFPVFMVNCESLLVDYLQLYFQQPAVWAVVARECTGTTKSRLRWKEALFANHEV